MLGPAQAQGPKQTLTQAGPALPLTLALALALTLSLALALAQALAQAKERT